MTDRRCLTPEEYAQEHRVSVSTIYRLIHRGDIPARRIGKQWRIWLSHDPHSVQEPPPAPKT